MKKSLFILLSILLVIAMGGCGKSKEQREMEDMFKDAGFDKKDAKEMAEEITSFVDEEKENREEPDIGPEESAPFESVEDIINSDESKSDTTQDKIVYEPYPEIVNSTFFDGYIQVDDMLFNVRKGMTRDEVEQVVKNSSLNIEVEQTIHYDDYIPYTPNKELYFEWDFPDDFAVDKNIYLSRVDPDIGMEPGNYEIYYSGGYKRDYDGIYHLDDSYFTRDEIIDIIENLDPESYIIEEMDDSSETNIKVKVLNKSKKIEVHDSWSGSLTEKYYEDTYTFYFNPDGTAKGINIYTFLAELKD